jgi:DNA invertase Pin-like site-specific DNA recombinase
LRWFNKLDRLARNVAFISNLMESGVEFTAVDLPQANRLTVHILAAVAEHEAKAISTRTKDALAAAKARGRQLGGDRGNLPAVAKDGAKASVAARIVKANNRASDLLPIIEELKASGAVSLRQIATGLNAKGIRTARGSAWSAVQVQRVLERVYSPKATGVSESTVLMGRSEREAASRQRPMCQTQNLKQHWRT